MIRCLFLAALALVAGLFGPVVALAATLSDCAGRDLRDTFTPAQRDMLAARLDGMPYPEGNHWRATRDGAVVHVIATIHLDDPRLDPVTDRLAPLVTRASKLLLEATPDEEAALQDALARDPSLILLPDGDSLPGLLPEAQWQALSRAARDRDLPAVMAARMRPWYLAVLLSVPPCAMETLTDPDARGLDRRLGDVARQSGVPLGALEPFDTLFRTFERHPMDRQVQMLTALVPTEQEATDGLVTLMAAFFDEAHGVAWEISRLQAAMTGRLDATTLDAIMADLRETMLSLRNRAWLPVIESAASDSDADNPLVVAVGAGHLNGPDGVLALLRDAGFTLERRPF